MIHVIRDGRCVLGLDGDGQTVISVTATGMLAWWRFDGQLRLQATLATEATGDVVGMAWLAVLDRVPTANKWARSCRDVQSVFVVPE